MPHLSKHKLEEKVYLSIYEQLDSCITKHKNKKNRSQFLSEILTDTERIMLAKRLAIMAMLIKGASSYSIEKILKISPSTVRRTANALEKGRFKNIAAFLEEKQKSKAQAIADEILELISVIIHPSNAVRWKYIRKQLEDS